ncbi:MAG TPA: hypothetical protein VJ717_15940 [Gemmatimonadaceae bacterium]|nr:hypothetical protein [Gemmatimonadaceae bacterium]
MLSRARRPLAVLIGTLQLCTACYQYVPVQSAPVGSQVGLDINDDGRVALREQLGPGIVRLEGRVAEMAGDAVVVRASSVTQIGGRATPVDSVRVRVSQGHIDRMDERRLSRTRTWMVVGGAVAIVAAFLIGGGIGGKAPSPEPGEPPVNQYRGH